MKERLAGHTLLRNPFTYEYFLFFTYHLSKNYRYPSLFSYLVQLTIYNYPYYGTRFLHFTIPMSETQLFITHQHCVTKPLYTHEQSFHLLF